MLSHFHLYGELSFPGVTGRRNGPLGLRKDDNDEVSISIVKQTNHRRSECCGCFYLLSGITGPLEFTGHDLVGPMARPPLTGLVCVTT